jgi:hypothetical protein
MFAALERSCPAGLVRKYSIGSSEEGRPLHALQVPALTQLPYPFPLSPPSIARFCCPMADSSNAFQLLALLTSL